MLKPVPRGEPALAESPLIQQEPTAPLFRDMPQRVLDDEVAGTVALIDALAFAGECTARRVAASARRR